MTDEEFMDWLEQQLERPSEEFKDRVAQTFIRSILRELFAVYLYEYSTKGGTH